MVAAAAERFFGKNSLPRNIKYLIIIFRKKQKINIGGHQLLSEAPELE